MNKTVRLGYEVATGREVRVPLGHTVITGQSQRSGKTTTLEALIARAELPAVAFVTKRGEGSFHGGRRIPPYFRERADWQFVSSLLEAQMGEKMKFERAWIMRACKGAKTLADVRDNVVQLRDQAKRGMDRDMFMQLGEYLDVVVPVIAKLPASPMVQLEPGVNVMDLVAYPTEIQGLVIRSVLSWVYEYERDTITIIPEAWEFLPQGRGSPVRLAAAELVRKGGGLGDFVWFDSQDLAGIDKAAIRQSRLWVLGVQREANEVARTLDQIPAGVRRPKPADIMSLGRGQFWASWDDEIVKVYVQPAWMRAEDAQGIATGQMSVEQVPSPDPPLRERGAVVFTDDEPLDDEPQEDEMNAEQEEKLDRLVETVQALVDVVGKPPVTVNNHVEKDGPSERATLAALGGEEAAYERFRARVLKDPKVLKVLATQQRIDVEVEVPSVTIDGTTLRGRLALLIATGFFDDVRESGEAIRELARLGGPASDRAHCGRELGGFATQGFLTVEGVGRYKAVPGMKVNIRKVTKAPPK